ncbi:5286_t:CDS:1 [Acaulospora morrowiae]|uniref:5286_t:CDS:1 n=1 Tax=Acaulospora morrowiae TaxID=94023 RepID=A0A9N9F064_9GLOM|nr:5286_t:CDS:1 [Acaulospora morrowiae]
MSNENIQRLPLEVLQYIFILSGNPHFPRVSQNFYKAANSQTSVKTQWLLCKYKNDYKKAFFRGLKWKFFNKEILNQLDNLYQQQSIRDGVIPPPPEILCEGRPIPQWFFGDSNDRLLELTEILLKRKASPNESEGYPIVKSVQIGNIRMVKLLIHYGAKVDIRDNLALSVGVGKGNLEMVKLLLDHGAQPSSKTLKYAVEKGFGEIFELLKCYGAIEDLSVVNAFE